MNNMNTKRNQTEATTETLETSKKGGVSKWIWVVLALLAFIGGIYYVQFKSKPLELDNLVDGIEYHVVDVIEGEDEILVNIEMENDEEQVTEVVKAIVEKVKSHHSHQPGETIKVEVFEELEDSEVKPGLEDPSHGFTGVYQETLKLYHLIDFSGVEPNVLATDNWKIEESKRVEGHLVGQVVLLDEHTEEIVYAQLKALESEMTRFNEMAEGKETYFYTPQTNQVSHGYSSVYPNHLIVEKEVIVTKTK